MMLTLAVTEAAIKHGGEAGCLKFEWVEFSNKYNSYRVTTLQLYIAMNIVIILCRVVISSLFIVLLIRFSILKK